MLRERRTFAVAGRLLAVVVGMTFGYAPFGQAATGQAPATATPKLFSTDGTAPHLGARDIQRYRKIFALQDQAEWAGADQLIARLEDRVLLGHVLYQRYMHPTGYRSNFAELRAWLDAYADHPDAERVYRLASRRRPSGAPQLPDPVRGYLAGAGQELQERGEIRYSSAL
jgi:soluble lytic murein transglycosylase